MGRGIIASAFNLGKNVQIASKSYLVIVDKIIYCSRKKRSNRIIIVVITHYSNWEKFSSKFFVSAEFISVERWRPPMDRELVHSHNLQCSMLIYTQMKMSKEVVHRNPRHLQKFVQFNSRVRVRIRVTIQYFFVCYLIQLLHLQQTMDHWVLITSLQSLCIPMG